MKDKEQKSAVKIGWKVVFKRRRKIKESAAAPMPSIVRYFIDRWSMPLDTQGPLCVFGSLDAAFRFRVSEPGGSNMDIYECSYAPSEEQCIWTWWNTGGGRRRENRMLEYLPENTLLAEKVKLLRKVQDG